MSRGRILAIHRYFWPDTPPYAAMLRTLAEHWAGEGYDVEVLSSQPSYKPEAGLSRMPARENLGGVRVMRIPMAPDSQGWLRKPRNMLRFSFLVGLRVLLGRRRDLVMCSTAPQVLLAASTSLAARVRGSRFVYHCMDLHPEIGRLSGEFAHPLVYRLLMRLDLATCRRSRAIVVLSSDMREALLRRDPALADRIVVINNFDLPAHDADIATETRSGAAVPFAPDPDRVTVAFTGNIGRFQGLEDLVDAVLGDAPELARLRLVLMGEGAAKPGLLRRVEGHPCADRIVFVPHGSTTQARRVMRASDLGLVSLSPGVIRFAYPSKTATYLSEGLPILARVEADSALAADVRDWEVGDVLPMPSRTADDWTGGGPVMAAALVDVVRRQGDRDRWAARATATWEREFSADRQLARWDGLIEDVLETRDPRPPRSSRSPRSQGAA